MNRWRPPGSWTEDSDMSAKEKWKQEWSIIRGLKGRKRLEHLWTYYKIVPMILFVLLMAAGAVATMADNLSKDCVLSVVIVDASRLQIRNAKTTAETPEIYQGGEPHLRDIKAELLEYLGMNEKGNEILIDTSVISADTKENEAKLAIALSQPGGNDLVICGKDVYKRYDSAGAFAECKKIQPQGQGGQEAEVYLCVLKGAEHRDAALKSMRYFEETILKRI